MGVVAEEQTQKEIQTGRFAGFEDGERDQDAWNVGGLKKLEKMTTDTSLVTAEGTQPF